MKNFRKLMMLAVLSIAAQQNLFAGANDDMMEDQVKPEHQGFGRIFTGAENLLTLHPGNAVNALATGNQADTSFGWHEDEDNKVKANRAHTKHNKNKNDKNKKQQEKRKKEKKQKNKKQEQKHKKNKSRAAQE